jgi:hypothetical protein
MGNSDSVIRNLDKRTVRREYRETYITAIKSYRRKSRTSESSREVVKSPILTWEHNVRVAVRKRPIFQHEVDEHEFDVVTIPDGKDVTYFGCHQLFKFYTPAVILQGGVLLSTMLGYIPI